MLIGSWAFHNVPSLPKEECERFSEEILKMETLDLYKAIYDKDSGTEETSYLKAIKDYAKSGIKYHG